MSNRSSRLQAAAEPGDRAPGRTPLPRRDRGMTGEVDGVGMARTNQPAGGVSARRQARPDRHEATARLPLTSRPSQIAPDLTYPHLINGASTGDGLAGRTKVIGTPALVRPARRYAPRASIRVRASTHGDTESALRVRLGVVRGLAGHTPATPARTKREHGRHGHAWSTARPTRRPYASDAAVGPIERSVRVPSLR